MELTKADRMKRIEDMVQDEIRRAEAQMAQLDDLRDKRMTRVDRLERIEDLIEDEIRQTEEQMERMENMRDTEVDILRSMHLLNLITLRPLLLGIRGKLDNEYERRVRKERHDKIQRAIESKRMGSEHEKSNEQELLEPAAGRRHGRRIQYVGRTGPDLYGHDERRQIRNWQRELMEGNFSNE